MSGGTRENLRNEAYLPGARGRLSRNLAELLRRREMTPAALAARSGIEVHAQIINAWRTYFSWSSPSKRTALSFRIPGITSGLKPASSKSFIQRSGVIKG